LNSHLVFGGSGASQSQRAIIFDNSSGARRAAISSEWITSNLRVELGMVLMYFWVSILLGKSALEPPPQERTLCYGR